MKLWGRVFKFATGRNNDIAAVLSDHDFECSVSYTSNGEPAKCRGEVKNISQSTMDRYLTSSSLFSIVAGYTNFYGSVFTGIPVLGGVKKENKEGVPNVAFDLISASVLPRSILIQEPPGANIFALAQSLANQAGYKVGKYEANKNLTMPSGFSVNGNLFMALKGIAAYINCYTMIHDDIIDFVKIDTIQSDVDFVLKSSNNAINSFSYSNDKEKGFVYSVETVVLWPLRPGKLIKCEVQDRVSGEIDSAKLLVTDVNFTLSNETFSTQLKGVKVA